MHQLKSWRYIVELFITAPNFQPNFKGLIMKNLLKFTQREEGLVTIEWVGIAAVMVLAAIGITAFVMQGADDAGGSVQAGLNIVADQAASPPGPGVFGDGLAAPAP